MKLEYNIRFKDGRVLEGSDAAIESHLASKSDFAFECYVAYELNNRCKPSIALENGVTSAERNRITSRSF